MVHCSIEGITGSDCACEQPGVTPPSSERLELWQRCLHIQCLSWLRSPIFAYHSKTTVVPSIPLDLNGSGSKCGVSAPVQCALQWCLRRRMLLCPGPGGCLPLCPPLHACCPAQTAHRAPARHPSNPSDHPHLTHCTPRRSGHSDERHMKNHLTAQQNAQPHFHPSIFLTPSRSVKSACAFMEHAIPIRSCLVCNLFEACMKSARDCG